MNNNITKTTLYFDSDLYIEIKKAAIERKTTITKLVEDAMKKTISSPFPGIKKKFKSKLCPGFNLGKIKGNLSREEIYDFI